MASNQTQEEQFYDNIRNSGEESTSDQERGAVPDVITKYCKNNSSNERDLGSGGFTKTRYKRQRKVNLFLLLDFNFLFALNLLNLFSTLPLLLLKAAR